MQQGRTTIIVTFCVQRKHTACGLFWLCTVNLPHDSRWYGKSFLDIYIGALVYFCTCTSFYAHTWRYSFPSLVSTLFKFIQIFSLFSLSIGRKNLTCMPKYLHNHSTVKTPTTLAPMIRIKWSDDWSVEWHKNSDRASDSYEEASVDQSLCRKVWTAKDKPDKNFKVVSDRFALRRLWNLTIESPLLTA